MKFIGIEKENKDMLMNMQELLTIAQKHHFAIPAFNIGSLEILNAVKEESEALQAPVIYR